MYFYLSRNGTVQFLDEQPPDSEIVGEIHWPYLYNKRTIKLILCWDRHLHESNILDSVPNKSENFSFRDLPILRSQLQKCARRMETDVGFRTTVSMCGIGQNKNPRQIGLFEMLRRLTIIIIEDCVLLREYGELVWYQCALSKSLMLNKERVNHILEITHKVMSGEWRDKSYRTYQSKQDLFKKIINNDVISISDRDLLLSVQLRNSFHGMEGDVQMLNKSTFLWLERMENNDRLTLHLDVSNTDNQKVDYVKELERDEILLEAFDHHCTDICERVTSIYPIDDDELGGLIWDHQSGTNLRLDIDLLKNKDLNNSKSDRELWSTLLPIVKVQASAIKNEFINRL